MNKSHTIGLALLVFGCTGSMAQTIIDFVSDEVGDFYTTSTSITITPIKATAGSTIALKAETSGASWPGATISFYADGSMIGTAATDTSTKALLLFTTTNLPSGAHTLRADFPSTNRTRTLLDHFTLVYRSDGVTIRERDNFWIRYHDTATGSSGTASFTQLGAPALFPPLTDQIASTGSDISFRITPVKGPLNYQWIFNDTILFGATNAILPLPNVQTTQAGV